jgi:diguanylate cyclase (GGDEF)-like protein
MNIITFLTQEQLYSYSHKILQNLLQAACIMVLVFVLNFIGRVLYISEQFIFILPIDAVLVGLLVRIHSFRKPFLYLVIGSALVINFYFSSNNVEQAIVAAVSSGVGISLATFLILRLSMIDRHLQHPRAVLTIFLICLATSYCKSFISCSLLGLSSSGEACISSSLIFSAEFVNAMLTLPVFLTFPDLSLHRNELRGLNRKSDIYRILALICLLLSLLASMLVGAPGAITFALPALLWVALYLGVFVTALLNTLTGYSLMLMLQFQLISTSWIGGDLEPIYSMYIGIALVSLGPLVVATSISFYREQLRNLRHHALFDMLSGALVRSAFNQQAEENIEFSKRYKRSLATMMIDIDNFKRINDTYGHNAGDKIITALGTAISTNIRDTDLFGRVGGEEFALVLQGIPYDSALGIAESIMRHFSTLPHEIAPREMIWVTISIGMYHTASLSEDLEEVMKKADKALYYAKTHGKNQVVCYNTILEQEQDPSSG